MKFFTTLPKYQLYLLQLENYELARFWKLLFKKGFLPQPQQRKNLVWTGKATAIFVLAELLNVLMGILFFLFFRAGLGSFYAAGLGVLFFLVLKSLPFYAYSLAVIILWPLDYLLKQILVFRARHKINAMPALKVIGIAGSYGKTTMKEILSGVLSTKLKVAATPESVNTPVGIARWMLKNINPSVEVAVVEMGEHYRGDVEEVCAIAKPDIAVVTGINEAHLERMKSPESVVDTIFEIVSSSKPGALVVLNADDENVAGNFKQYVWPDHRVERYKTEDLRGSSFNPQTLQWEAEMENFGQIKINLLGSYALGDVSAAIKIAKSLGISNEEIKKGVEKIQPVEHRLQPIKSTGDILVIDDAYNGNSAGVAEAVKVLSRFQNRRKIYITPGLVETGKAAGEVHKKIGQDLASVADLVILIKNSVTPFIAEGLKAAGYTPEKIVWFDTAPAAHENLKNILKPGDVVLFQNDWGDQYL
ncbi:MAG: UDP-N-acetylmuramoyl-tripeptide--D-alanyl-D-alanine ligase [Patescibacteria group bacterium]|nr:UDP-N-acetylmuramoyl-tripeptide--D-alanyl-D-alanine ligase [Patescibacteria group bacterium]